MTNKTKHTPEPWGYIEDYDDIKNKRFFQLVAGKEHIADCEDAPDHDADADLARAVACVNACAGIEDPEQTIKDLLAACRIMAATPRTDINGVAHAQNQIQAVIAKAQGGKS